MGNGVIFRRSAYGENERDRMFNVALSGLLPRRRELPGHRRSMPIPRPPGDATLARIGGTDGRGSGFAAEYPNELAEPSMRLWANGRISRLVGIRAILFRLGEGANEIAIRLTDDMSDLSLVGRGFHFRWPIE